MLCGALDRRRSPLAPARRRGGEACAALERGDRRTGNLALARAAGAHQLTQHGLIARGVSQLRAYLLELVLGDVAGFVAVGAVLQGQQAGDFIQAETGPLGRWADFTNFTRATSVPP